MARRNAGGQIMKVFLNGFGRIGRSVLRAWAKGAAPQVQIVGINDIAAPEMAAYLFEFDSVFGPWPGQVLLQDGALIIDGRPIPMTRTSDLATLDLRHVDLVMECTGRAGSRDVAEAGLRAGARRVLISGPSQAADLTLVIGANDHLLAGQVIVSNASCTTNALAPLVRVIHDNWGLITGTMTTIHCYTGSQPTVDAPAADYARSRAAALSMVPTTTSAERLLDIVLPQIAGRVQASAVRVPTASVSAVDLAVVTEHRPSVAEVNAVMSGAGGVIGATEKPLVSSDLRARSESLVVALPETRVTTGGLCRIFGWYDNEWGFSNRMLDAAVMMAKGR